MLDNASLTRIDAPPGMGYGGDAAAYVPGAAISVRCLLDEPSFVVQRQIDVMKLESTAVLYVELASFAAGLALLVDNAQVQVQQDGMPAQLLRIDKAQQFNFGGVAHVQCFVRKA